MTSSSISDGVTPVCRQHFGDRAGEIAGLQLRRRQVDADPQGMAGELPGARLPACGSQHPVGDPLGNARGVDDGHELARRDQAAHRMTPADQRFGADQPAIAEMDLRLEEQLEFAALGGVREFGLQRQARLEFLPDRTFERDVAAALDGLGAIEGDVAVAEQFVRGAAAGRRDRGADGDLDAMRPRGRQHRLVEGAADAIGESRHALGHVGAAERNGEFVAGKARDDGGRADLQISAARRRRAAPGRHWRGRAYR